MNSNLTKKSTNHYDGNGWSRYQIMVLQQLDDHNKILQNLNKELTDMKQAIAISDTEQKMWKAQIMSSITDIDEKVDDILYSDTGLAKKVSSLEKEIIVEKESTSKVKAIWAFYGAIVMFIIDIAVKVFTAFWR
jgi:hypothetical protein